MAISDELGAAREVSLGQGRVRYRDRGDGETLLFLHGAFCNGDLWRLVVPPLSRRFRCVTPDLPLASHEVPLDPDADLSPPGVAELIDDFMAALDLDAVTVVGNDTGGAFAQILAAERPRRIARLILTSCDAFEEFPPRVMRPSQLLSRSPRLMFLVGQLLRPRSAQRLIYRWSTKRGLPERILDSYSRNGLRNPLVVRDFARVLREIGPDHTLSAVRGLRGFSAPALVVWAAEDRFFSPDLGRRLAIVLPDARFKLVEDSYTFIPEDQPDRLAELVADFIDETPARPLEQASRPLRSVANA